MKIFCLAPITTSYWFLFFKFCVHFFSFWTKKNVRFKQTNLKHIYFYVSHLSPPHNFVVNLLSIFVHFLNFEQKKLKLKINLLKILQIWAKNGPKNGKNSTNWLSLYFWLKTNPKSGTSHFHTMFGSRDTNLLPFFG